MCILPQLKKFKYHHNIILSQSLLTASLFEQHVFRLIFIYTYILACILLNFKHHLIMQTCPDTDNLMGHYNPLETHHW